MRPSPIPCVPWCRGSLLRATWGIPSNVCSSLGLALWPVPACGWLRQLCVPAPLQQGCCSRSTKSRCCSILLSLLPTLRISQPSPAAGLVAGMGSSEPAPSPGFFCSWWGGRGSFSPFPTWRHASSPTLYPVCNHPAVLPAPAQLCLPFQRDFTLTAMLAAGLGNGEEGWEGEGLCSSTSSGEFAVSPP